MPTPAAIRKAQEIGLDLIVVSPTAEPPVAKAMDYGQWQYEKKKKDHEAKKKQHVILVKELKFRPNTDDHDYDTKKKHAMRFLGEGNRVKAIVQFRGREIAHVDLGKKLLLRFTDDLKEIGTVEGQPQAGRPQCPRHHFSVEGAHRQEGKGSGGLRETRRCRRGRALRHSGRVGPDSSPAPRGSPSPGGPPPAYSSSGSGAAPDLPLP